MCSYKGKYSDFSFLCRGNQSLPTVCFSPWVSFATHMKHFISDTSGQTWSPQQSVLSDTSWTLLFSCSVVSDSLWLCDPMDCNTRGFPVHHHVLELAQTHVHWVGEAIQLSHPLSTLPSADSLHFSSILTLPRGSIRFPGLSPTRLPPGLDASRKPRLSPVLLTNWL